MSCLYNPFVYSSFGIDSYNHSWWVRGCAHCLIFWSLLLVLANCLSDLFCLVKVLQRNVSYYFIHESEIVSHSVVSDFLQLHGL